MRVTFTTFDDKTSRTKLWKNDKFACLKELTRLFISTKDLLDSNNTTITSLQSTVYYIEVYAILLRPILTLCYHARKPEVTEGPASQYYVTRTDEYTKYLVNEISKHNIIEGSNISTDRHFTSVSLSPQPKFRV